MEGEQQRAIRDHNEMAWAVWHTSFFTAYAPQKSKKFWPLKGLLADARAGGGKPGARDWRAEFAAFAGWAQSYQGKKH